MHRVAVLATAVLLVSLNLHGCNVHNQTLRRLAAQEIGDVGKTGAPAKEKFVGKIGEAVKDAAAIDTTKKMFLKGKAAEKDFVLVDTWPKKVAWQVKKNSPPALKLFTPMTVANTNGFKGNFEGMTFGQLRKEASKLGIKRYSRMREDQLLAAIQEKTAYTNHETAKTISAQIVYPEYGQKKETPVEATVIKSNQGVDGKRSEVAAVDTMKKKMLTGEAEVDTKTKNVETLHTKLIQQKHKMLKPFTSMTMPNTKGLEGNLEGITLSQLREKASKLGIHRDNRMREDQLLAAITAYTNNKAAKTPNAETVYPVYSQGKETPAEAAVDTMRQKLLKGFTPMTIAGINGLESNFEDMTFKQLRKTANKLGIVRYNRMRKEQLLAAIKKKTAYTSSKTSKATNENIFNPVNHQKEKTTKQAATIVAMRKGFGKPSEVAKDLVPALAIDATKKRLLTGEATKDSVAIDATVV